MVRKAQHVSTESAPGPVCPHPFLRDALSRCCQPARQFSSRGGRSLPASRSPLAMTADMAHGCKEA
jgi:hypothetical protein